MINHSAAATANIASYVESYMDCMENLPDDVQRYISRLRELEITYRGYMKDCLILKQNLQKEGLEGNIQRRTLYKLEQALISMQELGDEKVEIGQLILDLIDNRCRGLDQEFRALGTSEIHKDEEVVEASPAVHSGKENNNKADAVTPSSAQQSSERLKRARRGRGEENLSSGAISEAEVQKKRQSGGANAKKKKRKPRGSNSTREDSPPREEDIITPIAPDIDEPTYCLCDQISYGEMILCDNDLCPIEWFHFVCVNLTTKPKGKWFCPKCRGDRPNVMKPKSQFLKELERYNKEKEEKS